LYVPPARNSSALFAKVTCTDGDDKAAQLKVARMQGPPESIEEINFDTKQKLDLVVIGSCAVSRTGQRLGKGNGFVDLDLGILIHLGVITKDTLVVTTVHDFQVYDTLPAELFQSYDIPIDIIVTPTEVIRVAKRLPRPVGIEWHLLSERRVEIVPVLKLIKEQEEK
jgi:5-formyltetrahydrofolate cyclo-ligase